MALVGASFILSSWPISADALLPAVAVRFLKLTKNSQWSLYVFRSLRKVPGGCCTSSEAYKSFPAAAVCLTTAKFPI